MKYFSYRFKTVNGMEACTTVPLVGGVVTPQKSRFWKEISERRFSIAFSQKLYQMIFIKGLSLLI